MSLSLKAELETWAAALEAYDDQDFRKALDLFSHMADSSKILTNMGLIYATIGEHETAVRHFLAATNLDCYLAIAHFQCGVSNFLLQRYGLALLNFDDAYLYLRGNEAINYDQIGLKFKLFSAEIMFNKGLAQVYLGYVEDGLADMQQASGLKVTEEHGVIDEAIRDRGQGYTVFSIPVGVLYRPSENKLKNSKTKDYIGKAKLVAASDPSDAFTEFTGVKKQQQAAEVNKDVPALNRSATVPTARSDAIHLAILERSKTTAPSGAGVRPDIATILAARRAQSVSNPASTPPPSSNLVLGRSNTMQATRSPTTGVMPLRVKTPLSIPSGVTGATAGGSGVGSETTGGSLPTLRRQLSLRKLRGQGIPLESAPQPATEHPQPGREMNNSRGVTPLAMPALAQAQRPLAQVYDTYTDMYTDDSRNMSSSHRQLPAVPTVYQQPRPWSREQQQLPAWMQPVSSPVRTSSNASTSSGLSRTLSRAANPSMMSTNSNGVKGFRRKMSRRSTKRRGGAYDDEGGDDGFVTDECDEYEMAMSNVRVKLHYQGDVRGMTIPPTTSYDEFVERVTAKFGTALSGLGMKFTDEEGTKISLRDEGDFELAIETAREGARGRSEGKIEVWCVDV